MTKISATIARSVFVLAACALATGHPDASVAGSEVESGKAATDGGQADALPRLTMGEITGLRLGVKQYFHYAGDRSDASLTVTVQIALDPDGQIVGRPEIVESNGGSDAARRALGQAGARALIRAEHAGLFARLPAEKYGSWRRLRIAFSVDRVNFGN